MHVYLATSGLRHCTSLEVLDLSYNSLKAEGAKEILAIAMDGGFSHLKRLCLRFNGIGEAYGC